MSGYTKHIYDKDLQETRKQLSKYVEDVTPLLVNGRIRVSFYSLQVMP